MLLPSISARDVLSQLFEGREVASAVIMAVKNIAPARQSYSYRRIFREMMRYTQLKQVVNDHSEQDRFFDRLSEFAFCRRHVLFWLQWSMAMRDQENYIRAQQYLDEAYGIARGIDNYDTHHLDDQQAGLILESTRAGETSVEFVRRLRRVRQILYRLISRKEQTSHPYTTILSLQGFVEKALPTATEEHVRLILEFTESLGTSVKKRLEVQRDGFIRTSMERAVKTTEDIAMTCRGLLRD